MKYQLFFIPVSLGPKFKILIKEITVVWWFCLVPYVPPLSLYSLSTRTHPFIPSNFNYSTSKGRKQRAWNSYF